MDCLPARPASFTDSYPSCLHSSYARPPVRLHTYAYGLRSGPSPFIHPVLPGSLDGCYTIPSCLLLLLEYEYEYDAHFLLDCGLEIRAALSYRPPFSPPPVPISSLPAPGPVVAVLRRFLISLTSITISSPIRKLQFQHV
ncbi:hypothetical protein EVG20_g5186 [Dentipellis fragilis]|uniref:Uncharacterized protein n=1 Tax=Dentipellis fragilis TaxID=205917 RepID=A0A4Y9YW63_9AGAM|nr:hypothetical protein EVG20_g5186 [Dentipellis fragilis]